MSETEVSEEEDVFACLPVRTPNSHKGTYGKFLNVSGSLGYTGAAVLSTTAAMRCGAGYVTLAAPEPGGRDLSSRLIESTMMLLAPNELNQIAASNIPELIERAKRCTAVLAGWQVGGYQGTDLFPDPQCGVSAYHRRRRAECAGVPARDPAGAKG